MWIWSERHQGAKPSPNTILTNWKIKYTMIRISTKHVTFMVILDLLTNIEYQFNRQTQSRKTNSSTIAYLRIQCALGSPWYPWLHTHLSILQCAFVPQTMVSHGKYAKRRLNKAWQKRKTHIRVTDYDIH